ncbi:MAG TPA: hypothetical protein VGQ76_15130 [Thermoanaerobaculia bacterium]|nr:hypothetical protein [Thermoanaerobaculia bacterium]
MEGATTILFRPVGPAELALLEASGWRRWPPRLPEQPIFYPVTNFEYAAEIASKWNVPESGAGYVTHHTEWWIPAEDLDELNDNIVGLIEVIASFGETLT